jgi:VIT1/CCC1 family predicted Fe2+/Mn2+ transporter
MTPPGRSGFIRPVVFGSFDGLTCFLGVLFGLLGHPQLVMAAAVGVGTAEIVGMAAGEWQSDSSNGLAASAVIGLASGVGAILPALPYGLGMPGWYARGWSAGLVFALTACIAQARRGEPDRCGRPRSARRAFSESYLILAVVAVVVAAAVHFTPGGVS